MDHSSPPSDLGANKNQLERAISAAISTVDGAGDRIFYRIDRSDVVLRGSVSSFLEKQLVQEAIRRANNQLIISNELLVDKD
ncbi:MAG TPA: hypothetical protein PKA83_11460 [Pirellulaceae bacterium]|nr:hypothetical protein [Pirellulaceae bacterium]